MTKRIDEWDFVKGFLIIMVMLGHTTASLGEYNKTPMLDYLSSLTVSFIMPFFLLTTGYFIYSDKGILKDRIAKKIRRLLVPAVLWGGYCGIILSFITIVNGYGAKEALIVLLKNLKYLWYLYATFVSALIITIVRQKVPIQMQTWTLVAIAIVLHLIPTDLWNIAFVFSFILVGHLLRTVGFKLTWFKTHGIICGFVITVYAILLVFFKYKHSIYISGINLINNNPFFKQLGIDLFRFGIGILGSMSIAWLIDSVWYACEKRTNILNKLCDAIRKIGVSSLQMYCTQYFVVEVVFARLVSLMGNGAFFTDNPYLCYFIWRHIFGFTLIFLTYRITKMIDTSKLGKIVY